MAVSRTRWALRVVAGVMLAGLLVTGLRQWRCRRPGYHWGQAQVALRAGDLAQARSSVAALLGKVPDHVEGHLLLARVGLEEARAEGLPARYAAAPEALDHLRRAAALRPADLALQRVLLSALLDSDQPEPAAAVARSILQADPRDVDAHLLLAARALREKNYPQAERELQALGRIEPRPGFRTLVLWARLHEATHQAESRQQVLERAVAEALRRTPAALGAQPLTERRDLLVLLDQHVRAAKDVGQVHRRIGEALTVLEAIRRARPGDVALLGLLSHHAAALVEALDRHQIADRDRPDIEARRDLLTRFEALGQEALEARAASPALVERLALAALARSDDAKARDVLERGIALLSQSPSASAKDLAMLHLLAARCLVRAGRLAEVRPHLQPLLDQP